MKKVLNILKNDVKSMNLPYEFDNWQSELKLPYFVGEISEIPTSDEDGKREFDFILTGEDSRTYSNLLEYSDTLRKRYEHGHSIVFDGGAVKIIYDNTIPVPVEDEDVKRIQINITVYLWEG